MKKKNIPKKIKKIKENECSGCQKKSDSTNVMIAPIRPL